MVVVVAVAVARFDGGRKSVFFVTNLWLCFFSGQPKNRTFFVFMFSVLSRSWQLVPYLSFENLRRMHV